MQKLSDTRYKQFLASIGAMLAAGAITSHASWPSPALPYLTSEDSPVGETLTRVQTSLVVSFHYIGQCLGSLLAAWLMDRYGRKLCFITAGSCALTAFIIILFGQSVYLLFVARIIAGAGAGLSISTSPVYNGEIADNDIRGTISMMYVILVAVGATFIFVVGPFVSYRTLAGLATILPICSVIASFVIPESPYYLVKKNQVEKAKLALRKLATNSTPQEHTDKRIAEIQNFIEAESKNRISLKQLFLEQEHRKALIIAFGSFTCMFLTAHHPIASYLETIMNVGGSSVSSSVASLIYGITQLATGVLSIPLPDWLGRKPVMIATMIGTSVGLVAEGIYFYLEEETTFDLQPISWLPLTALLVFEISVLVGPTSIPYVTIGEIFTMNAKAKAVFVMIFYSAVLATLTTMTFEHLNEAFGIYTTFWIYACFTVIGTLFTIFVYPETKGKSFAEIQYKLNKNLQK